MRIQLPFRALFLPIALLLLLPSAAHAILPGGDVYFGYSHLGANDFYANTPGLNGWELTGHLKVAPFFGVEAGLSHVGFGANSSVPRTTMFLAGPRVTLGAAGVHVFVHGLVGGEHSANSSSSATPISGGALTVDFGGGVDVRVAPHIAWRVGVDYIKAPTQSGSGGNDRFGTGLVFRF